MYSSKWIRMIEAAIVLLMILLFISGAQLFLNISPENEEVEHTEDEELIVVGFSQIGSESVWRTANTVSVQNALTKENGYFLIFENARQKQENQIKAIRGFISQRVDYIVFSPVTEDGWDTVLQEAKDAGIPVILVDRKISAGSSDLYTTWIGPDSRAEGEKAGNWLEEYLSGTGRAEEEINIVVLQGTEGSSAQLGRTMGFDTIADKHKNWNILEQANADFTTAKGEEVMRQLLKEYPDIDVVVSQNDDMTFGAMAALEEAGLTTGVDGDVILISFDAVYDALKLVEEGLINVDIECNPKQGAYIEEVIQMIEKGEVTEKEYLVEERVFTKENVTFFMNDRSY